MCFNVFLRLIAPEETDKVLWIELNRLDCPHVVMGLLDFLKLFVRKWELEATGKI